MVSSLSGNYKGMCMVISSHFPNKTKSQDFRLRQRAYDLRCILTCHTWNLLQIFPTKNWSGKMNGCLWSTLLQSSAYHPNRVLGTMLSKLCHPEGKAMSKLKKMEKAKKEVEEDTISSAGATDGSNQKTTTFKTYDLTGVPEASPSHGPSSLQRESLIHGVDSGLRPSATSGLMFWNLPMSGWGSRAFLFHCFSWRKVFTRSGNRGALQAAGVLHQKVHPGHALSPAATRWVGASMVERLRHGMRHVAAPVCRLLNSSGIARKPWAANIYRSLMISFCGFGDTIAPMVNWGRPLYLS